MRTALATLVVALTAIGISAPASPAAPTEVDLRIEGRTETLFEGPILTDGHNIRALGDSKAPAAGRRCNGLNNNAHPTPGPTPTAAGADAMAILGEGFDGDWYAAPFEDYFITQWGPDRHSNAAAEDWGLVVNDVFTSVGGCQYQLTTADEVLWVYDAFHSRPRLLLYPGDYSGGAVKLTAEAQLGAPFAVEVDAWSGFNEGTPMNPPPRSSEAFAGATVAPVLESVKGFEEIDTANPAAAPTGADGRTSITFATPGWHRLKATRIVAGKETVIRSNRLDVCVAATLGEACGPLPADDLARGVASGQPEDPAPGDPGSGGGDQPPGGGVPDESPGGGASPASGNGGGASGAGAVPNAGGAADSTRNGSRLDPCAAGPSAEAASTVRVVSRGLDRDGLGAGLLGVKWEARGTDAGLAQWRICSRTLGNGATRYVTRASGRAQTSATVHLPKGAGYRLRLVVTDALGRRASLDLGKVRVPD
ncbi:MAG: hypothetical protein ABW065_09335 [Solirubrobacterales bacterium]